jgi:hypothetical protein
MLLAAFIAMLIKSWVREFDRGLRAMSLPEQRAKTREFRYLGMEHWRLPEMVAILPLLIQISLLLFATGLVLVPFYISTPSFCITTAIFGVGVLFHALTTSISVFVTSSPFHSPLSRTWARCINTCTPISVEELIISYSDLWIIPQKQPWVVSTEVSMIILQKSRPYLEARLCRTNCSHNSGRSPAFHWQPRPCKEFMKGVPDSQHSEALQWSVWQVAGSPTLRVPPSFALCLPGFLTDENDEEYLSCTSLQPCWSTLVAVSLRVRSIKPDHQGRIATVRWLFFGTYR